MAIEVELNSEELQATLNQMLGLIDRPKRLFVAITQELAAATELRFQDEGPGWPQLKPRTVKARGSAHPILQVSNALARSFSTEATDDYGLIGSNVPYAAIHQFGGTITMPARKQSLYFRQKKDGTVGNRFVKKSKSNFAQDANRKAYSFYIPARPMLPIDNNKKLLPATAQNILNLFADFILDPVN